jgi:hypothetical protein
MDHMDAACIIHSANSVLMGGFSRSKFDLNVKKSNNENSSNINKGPELPNWELANFKACFRGVVTACIYTLVSMDDLNFAKVYNDCFGAFY